MKTFDKKAFLDKTFEDSLDSIIFTDEKGYIVETNKAYVALTGYKKDEIIGKHTSEFSPMKEGTYECTTGELVRIDKTFSEQLRTTMKRYVEKGKLQNVMGYQLRKDHKIVPVEDSMFFLLGNDGERIGGVAVIRDITVRKKSEEALLESEEKYRGVVDNVGIGIALISPNMEILSLNHQMQQWFPEADVSKKPTCYKTFNNPPREGVCSYCPTFKTLKDGQVHESITDTPQGDTTIHYRIISSPLKDKEGNITSAIEIVEDITAQKAAQEKLQESEEKYHNLIEHANDAIISLNKEGMIVGINKNAEEMFGYSREEILGKPSYVLVLQEDREGQKQKVLEKFASAGTDMDVQHKIREGKGLKKDGTELDIEFSYYFINIQGELIATAIIRDISERKEAEQKLIAYQKNLKSLTSKITLTEEQERRRFAEFLHDEIGQQLFATHLQLELLKGSLPSAKDTKILDNAINNIKNVMTNSRSLTFELSSPILHELGFEKALEWLAEQAYEKYDIRVTFKDDNQEKPLDDDVKIFLYQAVRELLTNVAKHAQTNNASLSVKKDNSNIRICVKDNGVGFNDSNKHPFDAEIKGFGLFRISERVEQFGGQFEIESQPNHGTQITLLVPLSSSV